DYVEVRVKLGPGAPGDTVNRPDPAVLGEVGSGLGMPILGVDDGRSGSDGRPDLLIQIADGVLAIVDVEASGRVGEIVLDVDDNECGTRVVSHGTTVPG